MTLLLRAKAARAAHDVVPLWPLDSFIAVNPLDSLQDRPFEHASEVGIATTRDLDDFFVDFRRGRIRARDLEAAVCERVPELTNLRAVRVGAMSRSAARITALELELAASGPADQVAPSPSPQVRDGLDIVDHIATKWVSAYLGHDPLWPMPHRDKGLYGAWSRMARFDPDLPARARKRLKSLETSADDALATALTQLDVTDDSAELAMRAELNALPGWTAHLKWRAEHVGAGR